MMEDKDSIVFMVIMGLLGAFTIFIVLVSLYAPQTYHYEYIDTDGNEGISNHCRGDVNIRTGRHSHTDVPIALQCELSDGTIIQVKQYKKVDNNEEEK